MPEPIALIEECYKEAVQKSKVDDDFRKNVSDALLRLQKKDPTLIEHWDFIRAISVASMLIEYWRLGVKMPISAIVGESFYAGMPPITEHEVLAALATIKWAVEQGQ